MTHEFPEVFGGALVDLLAFPEERQSILKAFKRVRGQVDRGSVHDCRKLAGVITGFEDIEELQPDCKSRRLLRKKLREIRRKLEDAVAT